MLGTDPGSLGKMLIIFGLIISAVGLVVWLVSQVGLPLGRLPGDIRFQRGGLTCFIPLGTSILLSILLTVLLNLIARMLTR
jgi:hypothetical protein